MTDLATLRSACSETGIEVIASLAQHRILTAAQVRSIHLPDGSYRWAQKVLSRLGKAGLAGYIETPHGSPRRLWHVTERGARLAREASVLDGEPRLIGAEDAAGALQAHTLAVNDSAICFLAAAHNRGDDFGPFAWRQEVSHPLNYGRGRRRRALIADAVLTYLRLDRNGVAIEQRFLEIDRATLSVDRLAAELVRYAELYRWPARAVSRCGACAIRSSRRSIASSPEGRERLWSAAAQPPSLCCEAIPSLPARRRWRSPSAYSGSASQRPRSPLSSATSAIPTNRSTGLEPTPLATTGEWS
ncbi:MAG TPA: replication-relaxation family protein [Solirubrobacterales bacterium]